MAVHALPRVGILAAARTPIGKFGGRLRLTPATTLGIVATREVLGRGGVNPAEVPELIFGHGIQAGTGQNPARQVLRGAGAPDSSGATTVNMVCGSGMKALHLATSEIRAGEFEVVVAGGMESMDSAPYLVGPRARWGLRHGDDPLRDAMIRDALEDAYGEHEGMGMTGERVARKLHLTREEVDRFGMRSHRAAARATAAGIFAKEIVPVPAELTFTREGLLQDEGPRGDTTLESLSRLRPTFA
ncbi:MAG: beta-ketoacyl synthase N-terminal-like domain-containing protein, partial [Thermoplasmata archaeon]